VGEGGRTAWIFGYYTACELDSVTHMASVGWAEIGRFIQLGLIGPAWFYFLDTGS